MNILLQSRFTPSVGGIESLALILCREWRALGHQVSVSTDVAADNAVPRGISFPVYHQATGSKLIKIWKKHDVVLMMNVSLRAMWPMLLTRVPVVLTHHSPYWIDRKGTRDWRERLKVGIAHRSRYNLCVSSFIRDATGLSDATVIPNCYDSTIFKVRDEYKRPGSIAFVGRLVSDKGVDLLLHAVDLLPTDLDFELTIIGDGPERTSLEAHAARTNPGRIRFTGGLCPDAVAAELQQHEVLIVPSLWKEPFGIVALEGMACGCVPLVSDGGGLPEAVGEAGCVFESGNVVDLAYMIGKLLKDNGLRASLRALAPSHLARHTPRATAFSYLRMAGDAIAQEVGYDKRSDV